ncbi:hypothetical protein [Halorubrum sp. AJ67]|uniref:hypothetical protein n=1 Tax=Halorubrum sp. AJ67 TaxID=1173487 RepID=UPI001E454A7B|nr:hypothetical protein [Halorubrum sp. AJ67]
MSFADLGLQKLLSHLIHQEWVHTPPISLRTRRVLRTYAPVAVVIRTLPGAQLTADQRWPRPLRGAAIYLQLVVVTGIGVLTEEGVFRGVPYVGAIALGGEPFWPVIGGTIAWAFLHGTGRGITLLVTTGWLSAGVWLVGHWEIMVGLHFTGNLFVAMWQVLDWNR